jgi:hypothetical protein
MLSRIFENRGMLQFKILIFCGRGGERSHIFCHFLLVRVPTVHGYILRTRCVCCCVAGVEVLCVLCSVLCVLCCVLCVLCCVLCVLLPTHRRYPPKICSSRVMPDGTQTFHVTTIV